MKRKNIYSYLLVFFIAFSCVKDREVEYSFVLSNISSIEISIDEFVFIVDDKKQTLDLDVKFLDKSGNELILGTRINTEIWINDSLTSNAEINLSEEKIHKVTLALPGTDKILSNSVEIHVISLENAVDKIDLVLKDQESVFIKYEDTLDFSSYINVSITDTLGNVHLLDTNRHVFDFYVDGEKINSRKLTDFPNGRLTVSITMGGKTSNLLDIEVLDPTSGIKRIDLDLSDDTRNFYALAGKTSYNFEYTIWDFEDNIVDLNVFELNVDDITYNRITNIPIDNPGEIHAQIVAYGTKSNVLKIYSREDVAMETETLPIIFHIVHNGDPVGSTDNRSASDVQNELTRLNNAYANTHRTNLTKSMNAVDSYIQFELASKDPDGAILDEMGIHRMQVITDEFETFGDEANELMFDNMWDPDQYLNVFVLNVDDNFSFAFFPTLFSETLPGVTTTTDVNFKLNYYYGIMFNNNHFGSYNSVLAHEIGHYLALEHTWVSEGSTSCFNSDHVNDTQDYVNTASSLDGDFRFDCEDKRFLSTNFMDYNAGNYNSFTYDQRERMHTVSDHALFFPRGGSAGGRLVRYGKKGVFDPSIKPVMCWHDIN